MRRCLRDLNIKVKNFLFQLLSDPPFSSLNIAQIITQMDRKKKCLCWLLGGHRSRFSRWRSHLARHDCSYGGSFLQEPPILRGWPSED